MTGLSINDFCHQIRGATSMRCIHLAIMLGPFAVALAATPVRSDEAGEEAAWESVSIGHCKLAVPKGWRKMDNMKRTMPLFRQGDGIGVPAVDETNEPLQISMTVEKFPETKESAKEIVNGLAEMAKKAPKLELVGKESVEPIKLADGTEAMLLKAEFIKQGTRRSLQMKLAAKDADSNAWIVSGQLVGGKDSKWPTAESDLAKWLAAHLVSFSLDENKFDEGKVKEAYKSRRKE